MDQLRLGLRFLRYLPAICWVALKTFLQLFVPMSWYAKDVSKEIVLITGAGSGLGRNIALEYARQNASLILWDINEEGLRETKELVDQEHAELQAEASKKRLNKSKDSLIEDEVRFCLTYLVDVSDKKIVQAKAKQVQEDLEALPTQQAGRKKYELSDEQIERIFKINMLAHFWTVRAFLPQMIENEHGHIVEIASMGGLSGHYKQVDYCATKFATVGFEESLSIELMTMGLGDKIYTTAICPFFFQSNLFTGYNTKASPIMSAESVAHRAVMGMRCNHTRVLMPASAYILTLFRPLTPRKSIYLWAKVLGLVESIRDIKGTAAC